MKEKRSVRKIMKEMKKSVRKIMKEKKCQKNNEGKRKVYKKDVKFVSSIILESESSEGGHRK